MLLLPQLVPPPSFLLASTTTPPDFAIIDIYGYKSLKHETNRISFAFINFITNRVSKDIPITEKLSSNTKFEYRAFRISFRSILFEIGHEMSTSLLKSEILKFSPLISISVIFYSYLLLLIPLSVLEIITFTVNTFKLSGEHSACSFSVANVSVFFENEDERDHTTKSTYYGFFHVPASLSSMDATIESVAFSCVP
ncbi:hypothetical protein GQX74_007046 [Glossina fuscipes]|nr:hypothetical protein GQX74_007046 [Glossina fuscipes]